MRQIYHDPGLTDRPRLKNGQLEELIPNNNNANSLAAKHYSCLLFEAWRL